MLVEHFGGKQGLALGISFMVMAIAGIAAPQLAYALLNSFSHQVSIIIVGVIILSGLAGSAFFYQPPSASAIVETSKEISENGEHHLNKPFVTTKESRWKENPIVKMFTLINWNLLKRPHFILTVLGSSYSFNALLSFFLYLPLYAESIHCTIDQKVRSSCSSSSATGGEKTN